MLVTVDLDGTLLPGTTAFEVVLSAHGFGDQVAKSDAKFFAGQQSLEDTFWQQWEWFRTLSCQEVHRALRESDAWLPGIAEGVALLRRAGHEVRALTDQPDTVTDFLGRWGFLEGIASKVHVDDGKQVGITANFDKLANLRAHTDSPVVHVGNGENDVPIFEAHRGVAVFAPPAVAAAADLDLGQPASFVDVAEEILRLLES